MAVLLNMRPDLEVEPHLCDHLTDLRKENQRPRSIRERRLAVLRVARCLGHPLAEATREELAAWQSDRLEKLKPAGMHNEVVHVSRYLGWLHDTDRLGGDNPARALIRPKKVNQRLPHPMPDADISRALHSAVQPVHVWIALAAFCGLRCMEIGPLSREDIIDGVSTYLRIIGKGDKERIVPLPESLRAELASGPFNATGHLFSRMDGKGGPPSAMRVSERINDHLHAHGVALTAHALRHRFGTKLYEVTRDPFYVAEVMGHASTDTTRGYVQLVTDKGSAYAEQIANLSA